MESLVLSATEKTPAVLFAPVEGLFELTGCSIHENADRFFRPLIDIAERYARQPGEHTTVRLALSYFNSSSAKYVLDLLKIMDDLHAARPGSVKLEWLYEVDDLDMEEAGQDYRALLAMPVELIAVS